MISSAMALAMAASATSAAARPAYDVVIRGGTVYDGSGTGPYQGDVAVKGDRIVAIAKKHGIKVIEDCAQSTGARYRGRRVGSLGDAAYYTFGLTKNITTLSGAMITTDDDAVAAHCRARIDASTPAKQEKNAKEAVTGVAMRVATHPFVYPLTLHPIIVAGNRLGKDPIHDRFGEPEVLYKELPSSFQKSRPRAVQAAPGSVAPEALGWAVVKAKAKAEAVEQDWAMAEVLDEVAAAAAREARAAAMEVLEED
jgi:hypothetical protein